jgi:hypothetical protein
MDNPFISKYPREILPRYIKWKDQNMDMCHIPIQTTYFYCYGFRNTIPISIFKFSVGVHRVVVLCCHLCQRVDVKYFHSDVFVSLIY